MNKEQRIKLKIVRGSMNTIQRIARNQMQFTSLDDFIAIENTVRISDAYAGLPRLFNSFTANGQVLLIVPMLSPTIGNTFVSGWRSRFIKFRLHYVDFLQLFCQIKLE